LVEAIACFVKFFVPGNTAQAILTPVYLSEELAMGAGHWPPLLFYAFLKLHHWHQTQPVFTRTTIEWLRERTKHLDIFLFYAHHSVVFCLLVERECQILVF